MADTQQQIRDGSGAKELVILVGILLTVIAGAIGTYWVRSKGVEAAPGTAAVTGMPAGEPSRPRVTVPAPPAGVFHTDVYFDFKSSRLRADAARVLQETAGSMDLSNAWVVLVQGYADRQGPAEYNRILAQRRAESVKRFLVELGVPTRRDPAHDHGPRRGALRGAGQGMPAAQSSGPPRVPQARRRARRRRRRRPSPALARRSHRFGIGRG